MQADPETSEAAPDGIDAAGLERWFAENVEAAEPPLGYEKISGGHSNLTFSVTDSAQGHWALRRPPLGKRVGNAHDMGREHRVVSALTGTSVPVAPIAGYCEDESVTGAPFYVMDWVEGPVLRDRDSASIFDEPARHRIGERVVDTLVAIHSVDPDEVGLGELGRKQGYVERQLRRWTSQWEGYKTREVPQVESVAAKLSARVPEQQGATIVHGDYRLDNIILTPEGEVGAVADWELCTLGDPLADVGLLLVYWAEPGDELAALANPPTQAEGFQGRDEVRELYAERSGRDLSEIDYYVALGYWKLAVILEGVYKRYSQGQYGKADPGVEQFGNVVATLAGAADEAVERLG